MTTSLDLTKDVPNVNRIMRLARLTGNTQHYIYPEPSEGLEPLPTEFTAYNTLSGPKEVFTNTMTLPKFSLSSLKGVCNLGMTQMEHYMGRNLEDRGGMPRITTMVKNYMDSLKNIATD